MPEGSGNGGGVVHHNVATTSFNSFWHSGTVHKLPKDFTLPKHGLFNSYLLFCCGNKDAKIVPLHQVGPEEIRLVHQVEDAKRDKNESVGKKESTKLSKWRRLFKDVFWKIGNGGSVPSTAPSEETARKWYGEGVAYLEGFLPRKRKQRLETLCPEALYNKWTKEKKRRKENVASQA